MFLKFERNNLFMKQLLLPFSILVALNVQSQITIDDTDMPQSGDTLRWSVTADPTIDPTPAGTNLTWDFSSLVHNSQEIDTFYAVTSTPLLYQAAFNNLILYPNYVATYATKEADQNLQAFSFTNRYEYKKLSSASYQNVGSGVTVNGAPLPIRNDTIEDIYQFPLNYNDTWNSSLYYEAALPSVGYNSQHKRVENIVEGWGTVITPLGSFDAIKIKKTINVTDSIYVDAFMFGQLIDRPESIEYIWLAKTEGIPVMQITEVNGVVTEIRYKDVKREVLSIKENENISFEIYPNPVQENLFLNTKELIEKVIVYDVNGKVVLTSNQTNINVQTLVKGTYFVKVISKNGSSVKTFIRK